MDTLAETAIEPGKIFEKGEIWSRYGRAIRPKRSVVIVVDEIVRVGGGNFDTRGDLTLHPFAGSSARGKLRSERH
jgi:hypothetical protein